MNRIEAAFSIMVVIGVALLAMLFYPLVHADTTAKLPSPGGNVSTDHFSSPPVSTTDDSLALLSITNVFAVSKAIWNFTASSLVYIIYLPKVVYVPIKHVLSASTYTIKTLFRPVFPILAPIYLAIRIIVAPVLVPVLLIYRFAVLVYPLYVFIGASIVCGTFAGLLARILSKAVVENVLGIRSTLKVGSSGVKRASPRRAGRSRDWST